jgi:hypothetical protein
MMLMLESISYKNITTVIKISEIQKIVLVLNFEKHNGFLKQLTISVRILLT